MMVELVYLRPGEQMPEGSRDEPWLIVEANNEGRYFGSGWGLKPCGENAFYASVPEADGDLEAALAAATAWAQERGVSRIWVQAAPA